MYLQLMPVFPLFLGTFKICFQLLSCGFEFALFCKIAVVSYSYKFLNFELFHFQLKLHDPFNCILADPVKEERYTSDNREMTNLTNEEYENNQHQDNMNNETKEVEETPEKTLEKQTEGEESTKKDDDDDDDDDSEEEDWSYCKDCQLSLNTKQVIKIYERLQCYLPDVHVLLEH